MAQITLKNLENVKELTVRPKDDGFWVIMERENTNFDRDEDIVKTTCVYSYNNKNDYHDKTDYKSWYPKR